MQDYTTKDLKKALKRIGIKKGDLIYVHSSLFGLGRMPNMGSRDELCEQIFNALIDVITPQGTLVVPTFTTQTARYGVPFELEKTECMTGIFSEYIRCLPDSLRSLHPINSVAAWGQHKQAVCKDVSVSNYGLDSPFDRMLKLDAKSISIGLKYFSNSWHHYLESVYCLPYLYNKVLDVEVYQAGKKVTRPFFAGIRYLDFDIIYDLTKFDEVLKRDGIIQIEPIGKGLIAAVLAKTYCQVGMELLKKDPYFFLKSPPAFRSGEIPYDGITQGRDKKSKNKSYAHLQATPK